jgi:uncharacterized protein YggE
MTLTSTTPRTMSPTGMSPTGQPTSPHTTDVPVQRHRELPRWLPLLGVAALAGSAVLVGTAAGPGPNATSPTPPSPSSSTGEQTVTVTGTANVTGRPDVLRATFGVQERGESVDEALRAANESMQRLQDVLTAGGVDTADLQTSGLWISPTYQRNRITGYEVSEELAVTLRDLDAAGGLITDAATAAGDSARVFGVEFALEDNEDLLEQARSEAVMRARASAQTLAEAADREIGPALRIAEEFSERPAPIDFDEAAPSRAMDVPLQTGTADVSVSVSVTWQLS